MNVWQGPGSRVTGLALLNRPEDVVVCDFHVAVPGLMPWIEPGSPHHGQSPRDLYRSLFAKYLRPQKRYGHLYPGSTREAAAALNRHLKAVAS